jgi:hypothetical protein
VFAVYSVQLQCSVPRTRRWATFDPEPTDGSPDTGHPTGEQRTFTGVEFSKQ